MGSIHVLKSDEKNIGCTQDSSAIHNSFMSCKVCSACRGFVRKLRWRTAGFGWYEAENNKICWSAREMI